MAAKEPFEIRAGMRKVCPAFRGLAKRTQGPLADSRLTLGGSCGSCSGAWGFPRVQGPAPGVQQAQADGGSRPGSARPTTTPATFLELVPSKAAGLAECLIELEGPRGKMRIQWKGATAPDLAELSLVLWESA